MTQRINLSQFIIGIVLFISVIYIGCTRNEDRKYLKETITSLIGKPIMFPDTVTVLKDKEFERIKTSSLLGSEYTIVKQVTADCPKCIHGMQLFQEEISDNLDTSIVKPVFIIFTDYFRNFTENILPEINNIQPLVIDTLNRFVLMNDLPLFDVRFHTFLLDKQNRIIVIGDPVNPKIKKLYQNFIFF